MLACNKGFVEVARLLLEHGAYIDNQSKVSLYSLSKLYITICPQRIYVFKSGGVYSSDGCHHERIR